ncbi:MAG: exosortase [Candidatus Eisenbacteria bacterium]|nr:exosortase [Candidatus Latescibacterota bacterium]MBD3301738.1 exosortase [Candidatus Eisenbacteria bacterium]
MTRSETAWNEESVLSPRRRLSSLRMAAAGGALLAIGVAYSGTLAELWGVWMHNPNYSHGFLIPPVTIWLLWRQRHRLRREAGEPTWWGTLLLGPAVLLQVAAMRGDVVMLQGLSLVGVLLGAGWQIFGHRSFRTIAFPVLFLLFMVPALPWFMDVVGFRLKLLAAQGAVGIAQGIGVAVEREGVNLLFPEGTLAVENACSGLRSMIALLALGALFAYFSRGVLWRRILLFAIALPIAVAANVLRIATLCVYAGVAGVSQAAGLFHDVGGYALFLLAFLMLAAGKKVLRC